MASTTGGQGFEDCSELSDAWKTPFFEIKVILELVRILSLPSEAPEEVFTSDLVTYIELWVTEPRLELVFE